MVNRIKFVEKNVDIVSIETQSIFILQCISADYRLETPTQQRFDRRYNIRNELLLLGAREYPDCIIKGRMIYLVPKIKYTDSIQESLLDRSLEYLKETILNYSLTRIAIPYDLDQGYPVEYVKEKLSQHFGFINCEIILCKKRGNRNVKKIKRPRLSKSGNRVGSSWKPPKPDRPDSRRINGSEKLEAKWTT